MINEADTIIAKINESLLNMRGSDVEVSFINNGYPIKMKGKLSGFIIDRVKKILDICVIVVEGNANVPDNDICVNSRNDIQIIVKDFDSKVYKAITRDNVEILSEKYMDTLVSIKKRL